MRTILMRLAEMLGLCFIMSPVSCALYYYNFIPRTEPAYGIVLLIVTVIFIVVNVFMLRQCYFDLRDPFLYYLLNYVTYGIFMGITVVTFQLFGEVPYAWLFNSLKLAAFSEFDLSSLGSTFFTHVLMLIVIAAAPIGMDWIFDIPDEEFDDDEEEDDDEENEDETATQTE